MATPPGKRGWRQAWRRCRRATNPAEVTQGGCCRPRRPHAAPRPWVQPHWGPGALGRVWGRKWGAGSSRGGGRGVQGLQRGRGRSGGRGGLLTRSHGNGGGERRLQQPRDADKGEGEGSPAAAQAAMGCSWHPPHSPTAPNLAPRCPLAPCPGVPSAQTPTHMGCVACTQPRANPVLPPLHPAEESPAPSGVAHRINIALSLMFKVDKSVNQGVL